MTVEDLKHEERIGEKQNALKMFLPINVLGMVTDVVFLCCSLSRSSLLSCCVHCSHVHVVKCLCKEGVRGRDSHRVEGKKKGSERV